MNQECPSHLRKELITHRITTGWGCLGEERGSGIQTRSPITLCFFCPMSHSGLAHT